MRPIPEIEGVGDGASLLWIGNWMAEYANYIFALGGGSGLKGETLGNKSKWICDGVAVHMFDIDTLPVDVSWQYCRVR